MLDFIFDFLFPARCVVCGREGEWWCKRCRASVEAPRVKFRYDGFERMTCTGMYHDPRLRAAIHAVKYRGCIAIRPALVAYLRRRVSIRDLFGADVTRHAECAIVPAPAAPERTRERGFEHATFIADCLREALEMTTSISHLLQRTKGSGITQATLEDPALRAANVRGVFTVIPSVTRPTYALLVDDVVTTGETIKDAARALRDAGVEKIYGFALALGR